MGTEDVEFASDLRRTAITRSGGSGENSYYAELRSRDDSQCAAPLLASEALVAHVTADAACLAWQDHRTPGSSLAYKPSGQVRSAVCR